MASVAKRFEVNRPALAAIRMKSGKSQRKLAGEVGVHGSLIAQLEAGYSSCSDEVLMDIAAALGVSVDAIASVIEEAS